MGIVRTPRHIGITFQQMPSLHVPKVLKKAFHLFVMVLYYRVLLHKSYYMKNWIEACMAELKPTDGAFFLGPVVIFISLFFMTEITTPDLAVLMQTIQTNIAAIVISALGVILIAIGVSGHSPEISSRTFMTLEGIGLFSAIIGFFFYGYAMHRETTQEIVGTIVRSIYHLTISPLHFWIGLTIWTIGIFLITYAGISARRKEESIVFLNAWLTLILACFFVWEIFLTSLH